MPEEAILDAPATIPEKKTRVQLDFDPADIQIINDLVAQLQLGTRAELFRSGIRAVRWMAQKKLQGCSLYAVTPDGRYLEPEFDFLERIPSATPKAEKEAASDEASPEAAKETSYV